MTHWVLLLLETLANAVRAAAQGDSWLSSGLDIMLPGINGLEGTRHLDRVSAIERANHHARA